MNEDTCPNLSAGAGSRTKIRMVFKKGGQAVDNLIWYLDITRGLAVVIQNT